MTTHRHQPIWSLPEGLVGRLIAQRYPTVAGHRQRVEPVSVMQCVHARKTLRRFASSFSATVLECDDVARWVVRRGATIDVASVAQLDHALAVGIAASRICVHVRGSGWSMIRRGLACGAGCYIVNTAQDVALINIHARQPQSVLLDVSSRPGGPVLAELVGARRIRFVGLHSDVAGVTPEVAVSGLIAAMARARREFGVLATQISLGGVAEADIVDGISRHGIADVIDDAVTDGCIGNRFPRPSVTVRGVWEGLPVR